MEKMLKTYDKEHMKMAMLKHEETFKQQVCELHRLYRVQKILMKGVENKKSKRSNHQRLICNSEISLNQNNCNSRYSHQKSQLGFNLDQPIESYISEINGDKKSEIEDESEIQLTLGSTMYSDSGTSLSSSSTGSSNIIKKTNDQDPNNQENLAWDLTMVTTDSNSGYHSKKKGYQVEDQSSQGRLNQPPWLLQALTLNMS